VTKEIGSINRDTKKFSLKNDCPPTPLPTKMIEIWIILGIFAILVILAIRIMFWLFDDI
jgi:hypothetical protein